MQTIQSVWDFFQNEILGIKWLNRLIGSIVEACELDPASKISGSVQFFFYDVIKIMVLLGVTFSFLISSPMVDLGSLVLLMSIFGWKIAVLYVLLSLGTIIPLALSLQQRLVYQCMRIFSAQSRLPKLCLQRERYLRLSCLL